MKVIFLSTDFRPNTGGVAEFSYHVCAGLAQRGHEVEAFVCGLGNVDVDVSLPNLQVQRLGARPSGRIKRLLWRQAILSALESAVRRSNPDVVIVGNYNSLLWPRLLRRNSWPYVVFAYGGEILSTLGSKVPWRSAAARGVFGNAGQVICISRFTEQLVQELLRPGPVDTMICGCGVSTDSFKDVPNRAVAREQLGWDDIPVVLTVARLVPHKGIDTMLVALKHILDKGLTLRYVIVGDGPFRTELEQLSAALSVREHVTFLGYVDDIIKRLIYSASDLYVMPSRNCGPGRVEGFGIAFLEANMHGLAVIGGNSGGIPDAVEDGVNGLLVPPGNARALASAIATLMRDPARRSRMAEAGRDRVYARFNWDRVVGQVESALSAVAGRQNSHATSARSDAALLSSADLLNGRS